MNYKDILATLTIIVDTREKSWQHIEDVFRERGYNYRRQKLNAGDYSFEVSVGDKLISFADTIVIERKADLEECANCFGGDRERFKREFDRIKENDIDCVLIVENGSLFDIREHNYNSKLKPQSFEGTLWAWKWRYGYDVFFPAKEETGDYIYNLFWYYARDVFIQEDNIRAIEGKNFPQKTLDIV